MKSFILDVKYLVMEVWKKYGCKVKKNTTKQMKRRKFRTLEVVAKQFINSYSSGVHLSSLHDSLIDVDTTRQYQPGDKRLDSRSSLRSSQTMSRVFNPEKGLTVFLLMDDHK